MLMPDRSTFHAMTTNVYGYERNSNVNNLDDALDDAVNQAATSTLPTGEGRVPIPETSELKQEVRSQSSQGHFGDIPVLNTGRKPRRSVLAFHSHQIEPHHLSLPERRKALSLEMMEPQTWLLHKTHTSIK